MTDKNDTLLAHTPAKTIQALLKAATTDGHRPILNGVAYGHHCIAATDTHMLAWIGRLDDGPIGVATRQSLDKAIAVQKITAKGNRAKDADKLDCNLIENASGVYPNIARVIGEDDNYNSSFSVSPTLLKRICEMALAHGAARLKITPCTFDDKLVATRPLRFTAVGSDAGPLYGVLMPMANEDAPFNEAVFHTPAGSDLNVEITQGTRVTVYNNGKVVKQYDTAEQQNQGEAA